MGQFELESGNMRMSGMGLTMDGVPVPTCTNGYTRRNSSAGHFSPTEKNWRPANALFRLRDAALAVSGRVYAIFAHERPRPGSPWRDYFTHRAVDMCQLRAYAIFQSEGAWVRQHGRSQDTRNRWRQILTPSHPSLLQRPYRALRS